MLCCCLLHGSVAVTSLTSLTSLTSVNAVNTKSLPECPEWLWKYSTPVQYYRRQYKYRTPLPLPPPLQLPPFCAKQCCAKQCCAKQCCAKQCCCADKDNLKDSLKDPPKIERRRLLYANLKRSKGCSKRISV